MPQGYKLATQKVKDSQQQVNYRITAFVQCIYKPLWFFLSTVIRVS